MLIENYIHTVHSENFFIGAKFHRIACQSFRRNLHDLIFVPQLHCPFKNFVVIIFVVSSLSAKNAKF